MHFLSAPKQGCHLPEASKSQSLPFSHFVKTKPSIGVIVCCSRPHHIEILLASVAIETYKGQQLLIIYLTCK
jgi:hypothetical protein